VHRVFLLSPASCSGRRATFLLAKGARFDLALAVRSGTGAPLGDVFAFVSGLYFRGKLRYASAFARPPAGVDGVLVITSSRGLLPASHSVRASTLRSFARVPIHLAEPRYRLPLARDARSLAARVGDDCEVVLLGSVATDKYTGILADALGTRLRFPAEFVGRGDMSRGGLMLRCVDAATELSYVALDATTRHGAVPPRLGGKSGRESGRSSERNGTTATEGWSSRDRSAS
jgi:hypothetical protein